LSWENLLDLSGIVQRQPRFNVQLVLRQ